MARNNIYDEQTFDSGISGLSSLEATDEFGRRMIEAERRRQDQKRMQEALREGGPAFRLARQQPGVAKYMQKWERLNHADEEPDHQDTRVSRIPRRISSDSVALSQQRPASPTGRQLKDWGTKGRHDTSYLQRISSNEIKRSASAASSTKASSSYPRRVLFEGETDTMGNHNKVRTDSAMASPSAEANLSPTKSTPPSAKSSRPGGSLRRNSFLDHLIRREREDSPFNASPSSTRSEKRRSQVLRQEEIDMVKSQGIATARLVEEGDKRQKTLPFKKSSSTIGSILNDLNDDAGRLSPKRSSTNSSANSSPRHRTRPEIPPRTASRDLLKQFTRASSVTPSPPVRSKSEDKLAYLNQTFSDGSMGSRMATMGSHSPLAARGSGLRDDIDSALPASPRQRHRSSLSQSLPSLPTVPDEGSPDAAKNRLSMPPHGKGKVSSTGTHQSGKTLKSEDDENDTVRPPAKSIERPSGFAALFAHGKSLAKRNLDSLASAVSGEKTDATAESEEGAELDKILQKIESSFTGAREERQSDKMLMEEMMKSLKEAREEMKAATLDRKRFGEEMKKSSADAAAVAAAMQRSQQRAGFGSGSNMTLGAVASNSWLAFRRSLYRQTPTGWPVPTVSGAILLTCVLWYFLEQILCFLYCRPQYTSYPYNSSLYKDAPSKPFVLLTLIMRPFRPIWDPILTVFCMTVVQVVELFFGPMAPSRSMALHKGPIDWERLLADPNDFSLRF